MAGIDGSNHASANSRSGPQNEMRYPVLPLEFKNEWPILEALSKHIKRTGWHMHAMPDEIIKLPDDVVVPEKLQQILNWSVTAGASWASPPEQVQDDDDDDDDDDNDIVGNEDTDQASMQVVVSRKSSIAQRAIDQASDAQSFKSLRSQAVVSDTSSIKFAAEKSAWKAKFLNRIARRKPVARKIVPQRAPTPTAECIVCFEEIAVHDLLCMEACRHHYCKDCLSRHIVVAMGTESAFPPKCCLNPIPLHTILLSLDGDQREEYQSKSAEYSLAPNERWYCPRTSCTRWIPPSKLKINSATTNYSCPFCSENICRTCRGTAHARGAECPQDFGLEQTLEVAEAEGWQRCYNCQAVVEHTSGCRHMTCQCRAEFCYVCGARWQTCHCTEADAEDRRADVHQRRQERIAAAEAELEEIARAIAEVEALERAEAEARRIREEERAREEAEQLAALETQRLEEEAARQAAEEEAERQWNEVIRASFEDDFSNMQSTLARILAFQREAIITRHAEEHTTLADDLENPGGKIEQRYAQNLSKVDGRYQQQRKGIKTKHSEEVGALEALQEEEEDDMFVQIQVRLRGKANKEARMERMLAELRKSQEEAREEMVKAHTHALYILEVRRKVDLTGIDCAKMAEMDTSKQQLLDRQRKLGITVGADRKFFEIVTRRRLVMLELHRELALEEISQRQEPSGIQDWHAAACDPVLPDLTADEMVAPDSPLTNRQSVGGPMYDSYPFAPTDSSRDGRIPTVIETADLYGAGEDPTSHQVNNAPLPSPFPREDVYLQPMPPPNHRPPTPPSSAVSIEAPHARRATSETVQRLEDSSLVTASGALAPDSYTMLSSHHQRQGSFAASTISAESREHRPSVSSMTKKSRSWFKKKDLSEEEIRRRMRATVGDAF